MSADATLGEYLRARRSAIEAGLEAYLPGPPECPRVLADAMRYSLMAGGKRLRPILCLASAAAVANAMGEDTRDAERLAMPAACALEMIHTYSLIHDDLPAMDNDTMRRGRPTLHVVAGEGMAILAGDGLLTEAFALMARAPASDDPAIVVRKLRALSVVGLAAGARGMVGGQGIDLATTGTSPTTATWSAGHIARDTAAPDDAALRTMHAKKTGALITAAAVAGAIMAGGDAEAVTAMDRCAADLGLAFQIVDDILDVEGVSQDLGKTAGKDAAAGKPTYPALYGIEASRRMARACIERAEAALDAGGFGATQLIDIGRWIVERTH